MRDSTFSRNEAEEGTSDTTKRIRETRERRHAPRVEGLDGRWAKRMAAESQRSSSQRGKKRTNAVGRKVRHENILASATLYHLILRIHDENRNLFGRRSTVLGFFSCCVFVLPLLAPPEFFRLIFVKDWS